MTTLALEFSSPQRSVAVVRAGPPGSASVVSEVIETGAAGTPAFGMIEEALRQAQLEREQVECLAIGLGPGSYTGVRASLALAQGWQLARGVKTLGLSSAECIAAEARAQGLSGQVAVVIDAQRNEFYLANYEISSVGIQETRKLRLSTRAEVLEQQQAGWRLAGPEVLKWFPGGVQLFPRAATLGQLARGRTDFVSSDKLEPIYLRETKFVKAPPPRTIPDERK
jgi:tRNA threonylcarbamoyl adenosine modification protein YeaZ